MPGYAITSSVANEGVAKSVYVSGIGGAVTTVLTATKKCRITNLTANNVEGGILPLTLKVVRGSDETVVTTGMRVFKQREVILSLVSQDARVGADKMADLPHTEIVLLPGDVLHAVSPLENSFDIAVTLFEGIS